MENNNYKYITMRKVPSKSSDNEGIVEIHNILELLGCKAVELPDSSCSYFAISNIQVPMSIYQQNSTILFFEGLDKEVMDEDYYESIGCIYSKDEKILLDIARVVKKEGWNIYGKGDESRTIIFDILYELREKNHCALG